MSVNKIFIYCSYTIFILDVLYLKHIAFYFCNEPSYIYIKFTSLFVPMQSAY